MSEKEPNVSEAFIVVGAEIANVVMKLAQALDVSPSGAASVLLYSAARVLTSGAGMDKIQATDRLIELCNDMKEFVSTHVCDENCIGQSVEHNKP
jgi:hypothetical protein